MTFGCGAMNNGENREDVVLCEPLQQLKQEHVPLRSAMEEFHATAERLTAAETEKEHIFNLLHGQVAEFTRQLKKHSRKEDDGLFPMMARYVGKSAGPIAVMEYEHQQAEQYLQQFLDAADRRQPGTDDEELQTMADYAVQAHAILTQHFNKEEWVLFPMAENLLSPEEKEQLNRIVQEK